MSRVTFTTYWLQYIQFPSQNNINIVKSLFIESSSLMDIEYDFISQCLLILCLWFVHSPLKLTTFQVRCVDKHTANICYTDTGDICWHCCFISSFIVFFFLLSVVLDKSSIECDCQTRFARVSNFCVSVCLYVPSRNIYVQYTQNNRVVSSEINGWHLKLLHHHLSFVFYH